MRQRKNSIITVNPFRGACLLLLFLIFGLSQAAEAQLQIPQLPYLPSIFTHPASRPTSGSQGQCREVMDAEPPFEVMNPSGTALERSMQTQPGVSAPGYYPKGTIVRLEPEDVGHVPVLGTRFVKAVFPRVKVLSVPKSSSSVDGVTGRYQQTESLLGTRARVGSIGYIRATDLTPVLGAMTSPANMIFQVDRDSSAISAPNVKGRAVKLAMRDGSFLIERCCQQPSDQATEHTRGARLQSCTYKPKFQFVKGVDQGRGQPLRIENDGQAFTAGNCDAFISSLSPVSPQNLRSVLMLGQTLSPPGTEELQRLQRHASEQALRSRRVSRAVGTGFRSGNRSKGMCKQSVNDFLVASGYLGERIPGDHAYMAHPYLSRQGFENVIDRIPSSKEAPPGSILVYEKVGGGSGHIEVKVDDATYCSDYCKDAPIDSYLGARRLIAIYVKKKAVP